ncbi:uncharacterized protein LOC123408706 [Hordeum vulgare subsp. vulgare]|uniref:uncharacterized protein LOC123408706 n=1 Tax=Hordeum vulgare subsp. vulgare TaxID=112509 RepID=UPI001D1A3C07|nr:uncharacterized protein LOC123408706 [Hordeum vulgare subsp. vulgare]
MTWHKSYRPLLAIPRPSIHSSIWRKEKKKTSRSRTLPSHSSPPPLTERRHHLPSPPATELLPARSVSTSRKRCLQVLHLVSQVLDRVGHVVGENHPRWQGAERCAGDGAVGPGCRHAGATSRRRVVPARSRSRGCVAYPLLSTSAALTDKGKFLLAARRFRHGPHTEYIISYDSNDLYPGSNSRVGKLRRQW